MTVLSRSKNAAARVTRHDCKPIRRLGQPVRAVHTRRGHPQFTPRPGAGPVPFGGLDGVPALLPAALPAHRPLVVSTDDALLDELLRVLAAAGAEPELATGGPALRRAHREAPLVLVGADALAG